MSDILTDTNKRIKNISGGANHPAVKAILKDTLEKIRELEKELQEDAESSNDNKS